MLPHEAEDAAPVPERSSCEEALVGRRIPAMANDRAGHVPALPARRCRPVAEVDLLAVHPEAFVEAAELLQHRAAEQEAAAEHPVGLDGLGWTLVEEVVVALVLERRAQAAERRAADERAADGGKAAPRR